VTALEVLVTLSRAFANDIITEGTSVRREVEQAVPPKFKRLTILGDSDTNESTYVSSSSTKKVSPLAGQQLLTSEPPSVVMKASQRANPWPKASAPLFDKERVFADAWNRESSEATFYQPEDLVKAQTRYLGTQQVFRPAPQLLMPSGPLVITGGMPMMGGYMMGPPSPARPAPVDSETNEDKRVGGLRALLDEDKDSISLEDGKESKEEKAADASKFTPELEEKFKAFLLQQGGDGRRQWGDDAGSDASSLSSASATESAISSSALSDI